MTSPLPFDQFRVLLARRLLTPVHTYTTELKCLCGSNLDDTGNHTSSFCNTDRSLHTAHSTVLRVLDRAARSQGLKAVLELSSFSSKSGLPSEKRPDLTTTSWPVGNSLKVTDLAITNPVSDSTQYCTTSLGPDRLLKKRELQKTTKYLFLLTPKVVSLSLWLPEHL